MTRLLPDAFASALLNELEDRELPLLSWGVTTGALSEDEVLAAIQDALHADPDMAGPQPHDVLASLEDHVLLFREPGSSPPRYRTRMAETLRLVSRLRQLFGWHCRPSIPQPEPQWWEQGRRLVADYRLHVAPRLYPKRELPLRDVLAELGELPNWGSVQSDLSRAYIGERLLSRFQVTATKAVFGALGERQNSGVIVGAGTGTGKTLSFYLPAFAALAEQARAPRPTRVHTLALYPRIELLRDQLREAVGVARTLTPVLRDARRRPLRVGVLYGATPTDRRDAEQGLRKWRRRGNDLVCPYLTCPSDGCTDELLWTAADRGQARERLRCASCKQDVLELALTRVSMLKSPPDLLFTTTEMLNRTASSRLGTIMGWGAGQPPDLVLLDEVHTYSAVHGAQVALTLRRWRNDIRKPVTFVGLSATLRDAAGFFAQLTGLDEAHVAHIEPQSADMEIQGREYAIALRGDPVSGADLLSTSIQTAMLFGRTLDLEGQEFLHGSTGFLFTDDLDVTNRFYDYLRDAEGKQNRRGLRHPRGVVLAGLRSPDAPHVAERYRDGQSWDLVQRIGRPMPPTADAGELRIGRTSSQDGGVDMDADLVVATAALEVGFDDPRVGLVLQHKAPYDTAAFIQRRGRAGRQRGTRPWTVVVLSDYGRDRLAYQAYDRLFAPEVAPRHLPIGNRYVQRIQATQALLDWIGRRAKHDPRETVRAPRQGGTSEDHERHDQLAAVLDDLLSNPGRQDDLHRHLRHALKISADEAKALLWEPPRSLLLTVVPTALRRLRTHWEPQMNDPGARPGELLPEFLTRTLFEPLNVPDVAFEMPFEQQDEERLPIERALREAVPGRVSKRYSHRHSEHRTWLEPPHAPSNELDLSAIVGQGTREGGWQAPAGQTLQVVRPLSLKLQSPPADVSDQSQGIPVWASQFVEPEAGLLPVDVPHPSPWSERITAVGFAAHATGNPAEVRRMTHAAEYETVHNGGRRERRTVGYRLDGAPAALGFRLAADGARLRVAAPDLTDEAVAAHLTSPGWRTLAFQAALTEDAELGAVANVFQRGWLAQVYLTSFALAGLERPRPGAEVHAQLARGAWRTDLTAVLGALYRGDVDSGAGAQDRLVKGLTDVSHDATAMARLDHHAQLLWAADVAARTADLARRAYDDTVAAAIRAAALRACPDSGDRDLIVDIVPRSSPTGSSDIWLTETSLGGIGILERLLLFYSEDPRRFWGLVESALQPGPYEYVDTRLTALLQHLADEPRGNAAEAVAALRAADSAHAAGEALSRLRFAWAALDGHPPHAVVAALSTRLLRPGSDSRTDRVVLGIVRAWERLERDFGFEVDAKVVAYAVGTGKLDVPGAQSLTTDQAFSLLWLRGAEARSQHLRHYQPYGPATLLDRQLVEAAHQHRLPTVDVTAADWSERYRSALGERGAVDLVATVPQRGLLAEAVRQVPVLPVDRDVLRVYGEAGKVSQHGRELRVRVEVREQLQ